MKATWKEWSKWIKVQEVILLIAVLIFVGCIAISNNTLATWSMVLLWVVGIATAGIAAYKKLYRIACVNIIVPIIGFLIFYALT